MGMGRCKKFLCSADIFEKHIFTASWFAQNVVFFTQNVVFFTQNVVFLRKMLSFLKPGLNKNKKKLCSASIFPKMRFAGKCSELKKSRFFKKLFVKKTKLDIFKNVQKPFFQNTFR